MLQRWTNDFFSPRRTAPSTRSGGERYALAFFCDSNIDWPVAAVPTTVGPDKPPKYPTTWYIRLHGALSETYLRPAQPDARAADLTAWAPLSICSGLSRSCASSRRQGERILSSTFWLTLDWEHRFGDNFPLYAQVSRSGVVLHWSEHHGDGTPGTAIMIDMRASQLSRRAHGKGLPLRQTRLDDAP